eukprot:TRINITY_DN22778_c0_g1_i2.p1 TRINITY_DN22778_c0_g1~~TRINITY_DN22778_c0_g1_i2.p1  ORF type:complete len:215 (+),score=52.23 TRINITY_DN22778_c0_g1_i2:31-645(+)
MCIRDSNNMEPLEPSRRRIPLRAHAPPPPIGTNSGTSTPPPTPPPPPYRSSPPPPFALHRAGGAEGSSSSSTTATTTTVQVSTPASAPADTTTRQDDIFTSLQVAWQWDPSSSQKHLDTTDDQPSQQPRSHTTRLPTVVFVSIPNKLSNTRLFLFDRGNMPLPTGTTEPSLMTDQRMMAYLNSSSCCFKIGGLQDGISLSLIHI